MDSLTMKALLGQLKGKTVEQQATAANAESWKRTKMIKDIKTYARLNEFVAFAATINAETGDAEMQKAYQTLETALDAAEADSSTLNDAGTISEVIDHVIEAFVKMKKDVTQPDGKPFRQTTEYLGDRRHPNDDDGQLGHADGRSGYYRPACRQTETDRNKRHDLDARRLRGEVLAS